MQRRTITEDQKRKAYKLRLESGLSFAEIGRAIVKPGEKPVAGNNVKNCIAHLLTDNEKSIEFRKKKKAENFEEILEDRKIAAVKAISDDKLDVASAIEAAKVFDILNKNYRLETNKSTNNIAHNLSNILVEAMNPNEL